MGGVLLICQKPNAPELWLVIGWACSLGLPEDAMARDPGGIRASENQGDALAYTVGLQDGLEVGVHGAAWCGG
jgi:hypothetical protein